MLEIPLNVPDLWQQDAVRALRAGRDVIVDAPTGAGKTRIFELFVESGGATRHGQAVYTVPTRALANDKWREWRERGWRVGLATGDRTENPDAPVLVATLETQRERILSRRAPAFLVVDEYQMLADSRRGLNYELAIALAPRTTQILLLSGSVRNPGDIEAWLRRLGRDPHSIRESKRPVPLEELPVENLPRVRCEGYWPRVAAGAIAAGLAPLLIFAPRRAESEKIARKIAEALPPDDVIGLRLEDERILGRDLARLVPRRVAYHHSGLPYAARAGWIEPLAKNGHLRVIVATTGLAAGINFSVRSVLVADTAYFDGPFQRELRPDELLQMLGRAGRRGLDEKGVVLTARKSPGLHDAAPRQLRRVNELDWPTVLRVMEEASAHGESPLEAATQAGERLFSRQAVSAGFEHSDETMDASMERFGPTREEFLDSTNEWRPLKSARESAAPLADCLARHRDRWIPAQRVASVVERLGPGRLCKLRDARGFRYGKEVTVAHRGSDGLLRPTEWIRKKLHLERTESFDEAEFLNSIVPLLAADWRGAIPLGLVARGLTSVLQLDPGSLLLRAVVDSTQRPLVAPPRRRVAPGSETTYMAGGSHFQPPPRSPAFAWRKLGLVDAAGVPTARGRVFCRFQGGEGLMIAAALEDETYPAEEIVRHLANLRGGHRFEDTGGASGRLAVAARAAYGHVDHEGYLRAGLCPGFGEGTWEIIERWRSKGAPSLTGGEISVGDVERAILEWKSLLRHLTHAPDPGVARWNELVQAAEDCLRAQPEGAAALPDLPPALQRRRSQSGCDSKNPPPAHGRAFGTRISKDRPGKG